MIDQAEKLRRRMNNDLPARTLAIISGKGGVGKSNIALNFSISLTQHSKKVLLFDLDIGMGNIDVLIGKTASNTIANYFMSQASLEDLIQIGPEGLHYIAGGTGLNTSIKLTKDRTERFFYEFEQFLYKYDYIIFDIGAGMTEELILFLESINEIIVVCTPEPTSVIDAYSAMKLILLHTDNISFYLLGNRMRSVRESNEALIRLQNVMSQFLHYDSKIIGYLPEDPSINKAVRHQTPFILFKPNSAAAKNIRSIAEKFINDDDFTTAGINMNREPQFLERLKNLLLRK